MSQNNPLHRYQIKRKISVGGMATVYVAEDKILGREVALKMMHPHLIQRPDAIKRFSIEAKAIATLSHDNIIQIFDYGEDCNRPFLVMEYIDGMNLQEMLDSYGALPNLIAIGIARQIISGLICTHKNGIIHRDIKPANILLDKNGIIRITDFGIAYLVDAESITLTGSFIGSPYFISPEQAINSKAVTGACDIFSLGVLLYFCLSGELPFTGDTPHAIITAIISNKQEDIRKKNASVLFWLADLIEKCLKKKPSERPTASEMLKIIDQHCQEASLVIDNSRIIDFKDSPENYHASEIALLLNSYQNSAVKDFRCGRITSGLRKKEQARLLENTQYICYKKNIAYKPLIIATIVTLLNFSVICFLLDTKPVSDHQNQQNDKKQQNVIPQDQSSICSRPDTDQNISSNNSQVGSSNIKMNYKQNNRSYSTIKKYQFTKKNTDNKQINSSPTLKSSKPNAVVLTVYTNPPWVTIYIDGVERGITPRTNSFQLSAGKHSLRLKKNGFFEFCDTFSTSSFDTLTRRIKLKPQNVRNPIQR